MATKNIAVATGKRKTSIARVFLREGTGVVTINGKPLDQYFAGLAMALSSVSVVGNSLRLKTKKL